MYICEDCGDTRSELKEEYEHIGGFQSGKQGYTYTDDECSCGGTYVEAVKCEECGDWASELYSGVCDDCLENNATVANAERFGEEERTYVSINGLYARVFSQDQINHILKVTLNEMLNSTICDTAIKFCLKNKAEFGEFLTNS